MNCLDLLARIQATDAAEALPFIALLRQASLGLSWGTTLVIITSQEDDALIPALLHLRRSPHGADAVARPHDERPADNVVPPEALRHELNGQFPTV